MINIHIVDDDMGFRLALTAALEDLPVNLIESSSGVEALEAMAADTENYGIVLMDIEMPGMSGLEACRRLRQTDGYNKVVIFISAHDDLRTRLAAYSAGGDDYFIKPIDLSALQKHVAIYLRAETQRQEQSLQKRPDRNLSLALSKVKELEEANSFMRSCARETSFDALAAQFIKTTGEFGLSTLLEIRADQRHHYSSEGKCSELEHSILNHAAQLDQTIVIGNRIGINLPNASLVASLPEQSDTNKIERQQNLLTELLDVLDARIETLNLLAKRTLYRTDKAG